MDIGWGGGRWTRYLLGFKTVYAIDYYEQLLSEFRKTFNRHKHVKPIKNNGADFPGVALNRSITFFVWVFRAYQSDADR